MRVCPKCGFIDPPMWRGSIAHREIDFTRFDDLASEYPLLAQKVKEEQSQKGTKNFVEDAHYAYHLTKSGNVERQAKLDNPTYYLKWAIPVEGTKYKRKCTYVQCLHPRISPHQTRLLEVKSRKEAEA